MNYEKKFINCDWKAESEHTISGVASPYGIVDQGGDIVMRGAFTRTLDVMGMTRPLLWQHDSGEPIGLAELKDSDNALLLEKGELEMALGAAQKAHVSIKKRIVKGLSIGYMPVKWEWQKSEDPDGWPIRLLKEVKLYELSVVTFPMNESAVITSTKAGAVPVIEFWTSEIKSGRLDPEMIRGRLTKLTALLEDSTRGPALSAGDSGNHSRLQGLLTEAKELMQWKTQSKNN